MCGSMVDVQSATAEIRRGKKEDRKKKPRGKNKMSASAMQGGHKEEERKKPRQKYNGLSYSVGRS